MIACAAVVGPLLTGSTLAGQSRTELIFLDDWPADAFIDMGTLDCAGGELEWLDPVTPVCSGSGRILIRKSFGYGCTQAQVAESGTPEPRMTGVVMFEVNGNLGADYPGSVCARGGRCPEIAIPRACSIRTPHLGEASGRVDVIVSATAPTARWIGNLELVGQGQGGALEGLQFKGIETITTFTPLPVPWELIGLCPPCGPEGVARGTIKE